MACVLFFSVVGAGYVFLFASLIDGDVKACRGPGQVSSYGIKKKGDSDDKVAKTKKKANINKRCAGSTRIHRIHPDPPGGSAPLFRIHRKFLYQSAEKAFWGTLIYWRLGG